MVKGGPYGRSVLPQGQLENAHKIKNKMQSNRNTVERHWKTVEAIGLEQKENKIRREEFLRQEANILQ